MPRAEMVTDLPVPPDSTRAPRLARFRNHSLNPTAPIGGTASGRPAASPRPTAWTEFQAVGIDLTRTPRERNRTRRDRTQDEDAQRSGADSACSPARSRTTSTTTSWRAYSDKRELADTNYHPSTRARDHLANGTQQRPAQAGAHAATAGVLRGGPLPTRVAEPQRADRPNRRTGPGRTTSEEGATRTATRGTAWPLDRRRRTTAARF